MFEQIKLESNPLNLKPLQSPNDQFSEKIKDQNKTKKAFKIKRSKMYSKKHAQQQIFSDPLYAGLQNEENLNENRQNFGPWVHSERKIYEPTRLKDQKFMGEGANAQEAQLRSGSIINEHYLQSGILTPTNFQSDELTQTTHLPEIKGKREIQEVRYSSLALQFPKTSKLSPLKDSKNQSVQISHKPRPLGGSIDILRCQSLRNLPGNTLRNQPENSLRNSAENDDCYQYQRLSKPSNVIFNYCCFSSSQNDLFSKDLHLMSSRNWPNTSQNINQKIKSFNLTKYRNSKEKQRHKLININSSVALSPLKKTISQELYAQLIKKKNRKN